MSDQSNQNFLRWLDRYGSSVILPMIALLILFGGIYLYTSQAENAEKETEEEYETNNIPPSELKELETNLEIAKEICDESNKKIISFEGITYDTDGNFKVICGR